MNSLNPCREHPATRHPHTEALERRARTGDRQRCWWRGLAGALFARGLRSSRNGSRDQMPRHTLGLVRILAMSLVVGWITSAAGQAPDLDLWEAQMVSGGTKWCDALPAQGTCCNESQMWYYDGAWVAYQIADYTGTNLAYWQQCAQKSENIYRPYVLNNNGRVAGWRVFPHGLYEDYRRTGDTESRRAALLLAQSGWACDGCGLWLDHGIPAIDHPGYSRDIAYGLNAHTISERLGEPHRAQGDRLLDGLLEHIDHWFLTKDAPEIKFFMVGLNLEAITHWYALHPDPRIPTAVKTALDGMWPYWNAAGQYFPYCRVLSTSDGPSSPLGPPQRDCGDDFGATNRVLNNLISHAFAWYYAFTGDPTYRDRGDQVFSGAARYVQESGGGQSGKEFSQLYRDGFGYVEDRTGAE